jgi:hypothetical protein
MLECTEQYRQRDSVYLVPHPRAVNDRPGFRPVPDYALRSWAAFIWLDDVRQWVFARQAISVTRVATRETRQEVGIDANRLPEALSLDGALRLSLLRSMANQNGQYAPSNLDARFSDPTFAIRIIEPSERTRFTFTPLGQERIGGEAVRKIDVVERAGPTLIQDESGRDVPLTGSIWLTVSDGAIARTRLQFSPPVTAPLASVQSILTVEYRRDSKLAQWVPRSLQRQQETRYTNKDGDLTSSASATYEDCRPLVR